MNLLQRYLVRGWKFIDGRKTMGGGRAIQCPHEFCGLRLTLDNAQPIKGRCDLVETVVDLSSVLANRRNEMGLSSDDIDHCAGLGSRHVQKVEDAGRRAGLTGRHSESTILALLSAVRAEGNFSYDTGALLDGLIAAKAKRLSEDAIAERPNNATIDTVLLIVGALGGKVKIEWGEPPAITRRLVEMSGRDRQLDLPW